MTNHSDQVADTPSTQQQCLHVIKHTKMLFITQVIVKHHKMEPVLPGEHTVP